MARTTATIPVGADTRQLERDIQIALSKDFKLKGLNEKAFTQPLGRITGASNEFQKSLDASNARVIAFGASAGIIYAVQQSFVDLIRTTIEVEKSLKDINVILNASQGSLKQFSNELFNIAKDTGQTFKDVAGAATELARQGLGMEETLKRTRDALILTRLSGLDTVSSVEALTAAINSFSKTGIDSTTVINKLANVDAAFAVSSADLANALQRVGSSAIDAGVSFDELLAIVTSVQQTTARGGAVIGNSLKTIFTRIQRQDTLDALQSIGIEVRNLEGNTLPALSILEQLAKKFDTLSDAQRSVVAEQVGGVFQINILKAALGDLSKEYSIYKNALDVAGSATDEAIRRNEELNTTVSALLNKTLANVTRVGSDIGEIAFKPTINNLLGTLNKGLEAVSFDSSSTGGKIGKGIVEGIGTFISGPGVVLLTAVVGKLFLNLSKFALDSLKSLLSLNKASEQRSLIQQRILDFLSKEPQVVASILAKQSNLLQVENQILNTIRAQTLERQKSASIASTLTTNLISRGVTTTRSGALTTKTKSQGHVPEIVGALAGGYIPGKIKKMFIPGEGNIIYNGAEEIKKFPGMSQPAVMPPKESPAGKKYKKKFSLKYGFDPYKNFAEGFVPNFALSGLPLQKYIQQEYAKKGFISISADEAAAAKKAGIPVKYLYNDYPFIDQKYSSSLTSIFKKSEEGKAGVRAAAIKQDVGIQGFSNKRPFSTYGVVFPSFGQSAPNISAGYTTGADKKRKAYRFKTYPFPGSSFDINEKLYDDVRRNLIDISSNYFKGLITKPQIIDTNRFKANIQSNLSRSAVEASLGQIFEAGIKSSISTITLNELANFDLDVGELGRVEKRFKLPYSFGSTVYADLKNSLSEGNLNSMARKIYRFENPADNASKTKSRFNGFIPNFSNLQKAIEAEAAMGGKPVIDFQKNIGLYVRDGKTQKNFSDVKRDHPEGIQKAVKNSKILQTSFNRGFMPNFAPVDFTRLGQTNIQANPNLARVAEANLRYFNTSINNTASKTLRFGDSMKNLATNVDKFNTKMEGTILTLGFLAPTIIQTAAQFAPQDARTQAKYNTTSQTVQYGSLGFTAGVPLAAAAAPVIGPFAAGIPIATAAAGAAYGMYTGGKQGEDLLKQEKLQLLNKDLAIMQDRFNQTQGAVQQVIPLIDQYKRTLGMEGPTDIKQANLDILFEKIVDQVSVLPVNIQESVLQKIREGKFEEIGALVAENFAKGAAEVRAKEMEVYFEGLRTQGGIKTSEEARVAAKALLDIRDQETGLRYTTTLAKTESGRRKIDQVIERLNNFSTNIDLKDAGVEIDENGQVTLSRKVLPYSPPVTTPVGPVQPAGTSPLSTEYQEKINAQSKEAALTLQKFVDTLKELYTDTNGVVAPEFQKTAEKAIQIAISSGDLNAAVKFAKDELMRTKVAAGKLNENITTAIETTQQFIQAYQNDLKNLTKLTSEDIRKYMKFVGQGEFDPKRMLGEQYDKELRQINLDVLNQDQRNRIISEVAEQEAILRQKLKDRIITEDQYRNALISLIESEKTKSKRDQGLMFADQYKQERQQQREARLLSGKAVSEPEKIMDVADAFFTEFDYKTEDLYRDLQNGAMDTAKTIKSEFGNAFQSIIDNSQTAEDAFRNMALNIARRIQQLALEAATSQIFTSLFQGTGLASFFKFSQGGPVKGYATGGEVMGGSGRIDDVPSLLMRGEYVLKKSAVNKYGVSYLDQLNSLAVPKMEDGGYLRNQMISSNIPIGVSAGRYRGPSKEEDLAYEARRTAAPIITDLPGDNTNFGGEFSYQGIAQYKYNDPFKPTSGEFIIDKDLNAQALYSQDNPQNEVRKRRYENLETYLSDRINQIEEEKKAYEEEVKRVNEYNKTQKAIIDQLNQAQRNAFNQQRKSQMWGGLMTAGMIIGGGVFNQYVAPSIKNWLSPGGGNPFRAGNLFGSDQVRRATSAASSSSPAQSFGYGSAGRLPIPKTKARAKGSPTGGEKDDVPALLMGGEYVVNRKAVEHYGTDFFDGLNSGRISKFAEGGSVGFSRGSSMRMPNRNQEGGDIYYQTYVDNESSTPFLADFASRPQGQQRQVVRENIDQSETSNVNTNITNNVNVNVTVSPQNNVQSSMSQSSTNSNMLNDRGAGTSQEIELNNSRDLATKIKTEVLRVIAQQQRPGGALRR